MHVSDSTNHIISHDPATYQAKTVQPIEKPKKPVLILAAIGLLLVIIGGVWYFNGKSFDFTKEKPAEFALDEVDSTVIATVGSEQIFATDLNYKKSQVPTATLTPELETALLDRLIDESIILQAGADAGYIELSGTTFNTAFKDQQARQILITQVTEKVSDVASHKKGAFVSIWFMNFEAGPIGYEEGKVVAQEKITQLHQAVVAGTMTIKQAGEAIKSDSDLAQLDSSYITNAFAEFDTRDSEKISFDATFNEELLSLEDGGTSEVILAQDYERSEFSQPKKDAVYMFGQVTEVQESETKPFMAWLLTQKENYAVVKN